MLLRKKPVSLSIFRNEELKLANAKTSELGSSFLSLFENILEHMSNDRQNVQITLTVDIGHMISTKSKGTTTIRDKTLIEKKPLDPFK